MHTATKKPKGYWKQNAALLAQQAQSMSNIEIARLHNATPRHISNQLHLIGVPSFNPPDALDNRKAELERLLQTYSVAQLAELQDRTESALRQEMHKLGVAAPNPRPRVWEGRKPQLAIDAQSMSATELAAKYGCQLSYMHCLLCRFGITAQTKPQAPAKPKAPAKVKAEPKAKATAPAKPKTAAKPKPASTPKPSTQSGLKAIVARPRMAAPAPIMQAAIPRSSIATTSKVPPQIIWPEHVKVQHITPQPLPSNAPIQASTMRTPYCTGQGLMGYQSF